MPEVEDGEAIRSSSTRVVAFPDGLGNKVRGERVKVVIEGMGFGDGTTDAAGVRGMGVRGDVSELFDEVKGNGLVGGEGATGESDGLVRWVMDVFAGEIPNVGPEFGGVGGVGARCHFVGPDLPVVLVYCCGYLGV